MRGATAGLFALIVGGALVADEPYWRGVERTPGPAFCAGPAATDVKVVCDRWPDGSDLRQFGLDAMRLSDAKTPQEQAIAVWRWVRRWTMYTDGNVPTEKAYLRGGVLDPIKVLNVYGTHWCDGLSRAMELVWRAQGGRAEKHYRAGHTMCDVFYRDADGVARWHLFDVSEGGFMFDRARNRLLSSEEMSTDVYNYMATWIHCAHLPWPSHRVELALRPGERIDRLWRADGPLYQQNIRFNHQTVPASERGPYPIGYGTGTLTYQPVGAVTQSPSAGKDRTPGGGGSTTETWRDGLAGAAVNLTLSEGLLQPEKTAEPASAVWRIRSPYIIAGATVDLAGRRASEQDVVRLLLSADDGRSWKTVWETDGVGDVSARRLDVCPRYTVTMNAPRPEGMISPFGTYAYLVKLEMQAAKPGSAAVSRLAFTTHFQHNLYALPQLHPGRNRITVSGTLAADAALEVTYTWDDRQGAGRKNVTVLEALPHTYEILADGAAWNDVACQSVSVRAIPRTGQGNRTVVREAPPKGAVATRTEMAPAETTRARWRRPIEGPLRPAADYIAVLTAARDRAAVPGPVQGGPPDGVEESQGDPAADASEPGDARLDETGRGTSSKPADGRRPESAPAEEDRWPALSAREALAALNDLAPSEAFEAVKSAVYERAGRNEKEHAVVALYNIDPKRAVPVLLDVLDHPEKVTWKEDPTNAAVARGHWCGVATIIAEIMVREHEAHPPPSGGDSLPGAAAPQAAVPALLRVLECPDAWADVRWQMVRSLGRLGDPRAREAVRKCLRSNDGDLVALAATAAGQLGDAEAIPRLRELLKSDFTLYLQNAATALGLLGDSASAPRLRALLAHPDENVRAAAAEALGRLADGEAGPLLKSLTTRDPFPWVREVTGQAIKGITARVAAPGDG